MLCIQMLLRSIVLGLRLGCTIFVGSLTLLLLILPQRLVFSIVSLLRLLFMVRLHALRKTGKYFSAVDAFEALVESDPNHVQFVCADDAGRKTTLHDLDVLANKVAHWVTELGLGHGDSIALMMSNKPELVGFYLGAAKSCVSTALINTNATGRALLHSVTLATESCGAGKKVLVVDKEFLTAWEQDADQSHVVSGLDEMGVKVCVWQDLVAPQGEIWMQPSQRPPASLRHAVVNEKDAFLLIFTSGTTGLPKASKISHSRWYLGTLPLGIFCKLRKGDAVYSPLPLFHSAACIMGVGGCMRSRCTIVIRSKFSASSFSKDCFDHNVVAVQYIGELCRYLIHAAPSEYDARLKVHTMMGNGLAADCWKKFQARYKVQHVVEFYLSTEGNVALFNATDQKVGALGWIPRFWDFIYPVKLVAPDPHDASVPLRDPATGHCRSVEPNETGLLLGEINFKRVDRRFDGYTDARATASKVLESVFKPNDRFFCTGDLLTRDAAGYFYWKDRVGDTYRWRSENIATSEVAGVLAEVSGVGDVCVYGVPVPNCEGKAGMASVSLCCKDEPLDLSSLLRVQKANLPPAAVVRFVRVMKDIPKTSTFKHQKNELCKAGFASDLCGEDPIYVLDSSNNCYVPLTPDLRASIASSTFRL